MALGPGLRFCVVNLGCKVNRVESDTITAHLLHEGGIAVSQEEADLIVVNTCTVTGEAEKKARKAVRHALRCSPKAQVIVTGCAVAIDPGTYSALDGRVRIVPKGRIIEEIGSQLDGSPLRIGDAFRTRVNLKVQDGCDRACTYCIVHVARGPATSTPFDQVLKESETYLRNGAKEVVLTGIDLGSYHHDGKRLTDLVTAILDIGDELASEDTLRARVRASSIEPVSIDERFVALLEARDGRLCRHLHLPLQSGSTKVLREMARPYSAESFVRLVSDMRSRIPSLSLTTDIIVGFPGETEDDFQQTMELARECRFSKIHVFPYSKRAGTPAADRPDQVDERIKAERASLMRRLSDELRDLDKARRSGTWEYAIVEGSTALTESYHEVPAPEDARTGTLMKYHFQ